MKKILSIMSLALCCGGAIANNVQISNVSLGGQVTASDYSKVSFDISWDNSWRTNTNESNYDGCWVFVKFRKQGTSLWKHATLNYASPGTAAASGHTQPSGSTIKQSADGKGIWIYKDANGIGSNYFSGTSLRWNYGVDGVLDNDSVEVRVFAIEMVYIPQGAFNLGSGGSDFNQFVTYGAAAATTNPYNVASNNAIQVGPTLGNLYYDNGSLSYPYTGGGGDQNGPIPAAFPKGYNAFWIMKYECSQQQYTDFLLSLDQTRFNNRNNLVDTGTYPNIGAPAPEHAMHSLSMLDLIAYSDWAGMRPYTEMEYEKACRGYNQTPIPNEYPWGNTSVTNIGSINYVGLENESSNVGNCNYNSASPRRCGMFATALSNRNQSGATYYGVMDMAGNVYELTVSVGSAPARLFTATVNGDGNLDAAGNSDITVWNNIGNSNSVSYKGGAFNVGAIGYIQTSARYSSIASGANRSAAYGIRLARTAE